MKTSVVSVCGNTRSPEPRRMMTNTKKVLREKSKWIMITTNGNNWNLTFRELLPETAQLPRATFHFAWVSVVMKTLLGKQNPDWIRDCWESCSGHFFPQLVRNVSNMWIWFLFLFKCGYRMFEMTCWFTVVMKNISVVQHRLETPRNSIKKEM